MKNKENLTSQQIKHRESQKQKSQPTFSIKAFFRAYVNAMRAKALFFNYPFFVSKATAEVLICLEKNGRIAGYKFFPQNQNVKVFLNYDLTQGKSLIPRIIYYSSQGRTRSANLKNLQQFQMQNPNSFTLIGTKHGILDVKSCLLHKCGGIFLVSLD